MRQISFKRQLPKILSILAILFGVITIFVGARVLLNSSDPGYIVFKPLLIFNTLMGFMYIWAGGVIWKNTFKGKYAAKWLVTLNLIVLIAITIIFILAENIVAIDSLFAMIFRAAIWIIILFGLFFTNNKSD